MRARLCILSLFTLASAAHAQYQASSWFKADYLYSDYHLKAPNTLEEKGQYPGVRGEIGVNLLGFLAVSGAAEYADYRLDYSGPTLTNAIVKKPTADYSRDLRAMAHIVMSSAVLSGGLAQRETYQNLESTYRQRTTYTYLPVQVSYFWRNFNVIYEQDLWRRGDVRASLSDLGAGERNVDLTLGKGQGFSVELGYFIPSALGATHLFVRYQKLTIKASNVLNDGVHDVSTPETTASWMQAGVGIGF